MRKIPVYFPYNSIVIEIFSTHYWHSEVQDLMVGSKKISFHFEHLPTCQ